VNENNVDLNRNFRADGSRPAPATGYSKLDSFLNPQSGPARDLYFMKAAWLIARYGMTALKQAIVGGQYQFPKGLFFGGQQMEQGPAAYTSFLKQRLEDTTRLIAIDVHTGIGKFAEDVLLVDTKDFARFSQIFGDRVTPLQPEASPAYRVEGGMESLILRIFSEIDPFFICQEFGTYSGIRVLHALREENRWHHYGGGTPDHSTKRNLKNLFCPDNALWQTAVLKRGREVVAQAMNEL